MHMLACEPDPPVMITYVHLQLRMHSHLDSAHALPIFTLTGTARVPCASFVDLSLLNTGSPEPSRMPLRSRCPAEPVPLCGPELKVQFASIFVRLDLTSDKLGEKQLQMRLKLCDVHACVIGDGCCTFLR